MAMWPIHDFGGRMVIVAKKLAWYRWYDPSPDYKADSAATDIILSQVSELLQLGLNALPGPVQEKPLTGGLMTFSWHQHSAIFANLERTIGTMRCGLISFSSVLARHCRYQRGFFSDMHLHELEKRGVGISEKTCKSLPLFSRQ